MKTTITTIIRRVMYFTLYLLNIAAGNKLPRAVIFCYHSAEANDWRFSIDPDVIIRQVEYLRSKYEIISFDDLKAYIKGQKRLKRPAAVITFDDGYRDVLKLTEYFKDHGIRPVMYVLADPDHADRVEMDNTLPIMSFDEVRQLKQAGWTIGCHSATHPFFGALSDEAVTREVYDAKEMLEKKLGFEVPDFSFPRGRYDDRILDAAQRAGYESAVTMDDSLIDHATDLLRIPRVGVDRTHSFMEFKSIGTPLSIKFRQMLKRTFIGGML